MDKQTFLNQEHVKYYTDKGAYLHTRSEFEETEKAKDNYRNESYSVTLKNVTGKVLVRAGSRVSLDKALDNLSKHVNEKLEEQLKVSKPLETLRARVNEITDLYFHNNDKAKRLSRNETYHGWDLITYADGRTAEIWVHNAGNVVLHFDLLCKYGNSIRINMNCISSDPWRGELEYLPLLLDAIKQYYDSDLTERAKELNKES